MDIGVVVIGSELTSGKRSDAHLAQAIKALARRGMELDWATTVADRPDRIVRTLRRSLADGDLVLCFGGLGCTPDDHTRRCAAEAAGVPLAPHPEAVAAIEAQFGAEAWPVRVRMAELPLGCTLIPNPESGCPGFSLGDHHFLPGFRSMAWPMMDWVLDTHYAHLHDPSPTVEYLIRAQEARESDLLEVLEHFVERFPHVRLASLPHRDEHQWYVELGVRGHEREARSGLEWLTGELDRRGYRWQAWGGP
ncbi:MAG: molybdopterin-binding protein [Gammaproteobacteria bacterium]|nr:molybdopterin-binding protein [Gammaproteobacteria bacterium]